MAITAGDYLRPARSLASSSVPSLICLESSGQSFKPGELLQMRSGKVALCNTTSDVLKIGSASGTIYGVSATTGKNLTGTPNWNQSSDTVSIIPAVHWMMWEVAVANSTTASSVIAATNIGLTYVLKRSTTNKVWYLSLASTAAHFTVLGFRDAVGTRNGHVYGVFHDSARFAAIK